MGTASCGRRALLPIFVLVLVALAASVLAANLIFRYSDDDWPYWETVHDIRCLSLGLEAFKLKYKVYPPSRILLSNDAADYADDPESKVYLEAIWPRLHWTSGNIDWSGGVPGFKSAKLEGDQCLVFFLAGPGQQGFSRDPSNPTALGGSLRIGPFFEFSSRLIRRLPESPLPSYQDGYGKNVYAYFSSGRDGTFRHDCPGLKVIPYHQRLARPAGFLCPNSFQIISAGQDGVFGPGGAWPEDLGPHGLDDVANFHEGFLGSVRR
jgi:hypothetical protein